MRQFFQIFVFFTVLSSVTAQPAKKIKLKGTFKGNSEGTDYNKVTVTSEGAFARNIYFTNTVVIKRNHKYKWTTYNKNDSTTSVHLGTWRLVGDSVFFEHIPENSYLKRPNSKYKVHTVETKLPVLDKKARIANKYTLYVQGNYVVKKELAKNLKGTYYGTQSIPTGRLIDTGKSLLEDAIDTQHTLVLKGGNKFTWIRMTSSPKIDAQKQDVEKGKWHLRGDTIYFKFTSNDHNLCPYMVVAPNDSILMPCPDLRLFLKKQK